MGKKKKRPRMLITYEIREFNGDIVHRQGATDIDTGFQSICEIIRKM